MSRLPAIAPALALAFSAPGAGDQSAAERFEAERMQVASRAGQTPTARARAGARC